VTVLAGIGCTLILTIAYIAKPYIIVAFGRNDEEIFTRFYWTVFPYIFLYLIFSLTEPLFWLSGKSVVYNLIKETGFRVLTTGFLVLLLFNVIHLTGFMYLYAFLYLIPTGAAVIYLYRTKQFTWHPKVSPVTKRLKGKMVTFSSFLFFTGLMTLVVRVCDTLFLAGQKSFAQAGLFVYALYFSQILDVPNRSITGGAVPVLVEYWRTKNLKGIASIYRKSAMNLMIAGLALGGLIVINLPSVIRFFPDNFKVPILPTVILIIAQLINLATGLNAQIIHTSNRWRFDFISTMIYSVISLPLNFFFIRYMGIIGAAMATLVSSVFYNTYRWIFLYKNFKLQPFEWKNLELLLIATVLTALLYFIPPFPNMFSFDFLNLAIDIALRSALFAGIFGVVVISRRYAEEVNALWIKLSKKPLKLIRK
jgi:O-antigen/teichoic acid export membrane protein